jgi:hypothetical protein
MALQLGMGPEGNKQKLKQSVAVSAMDLFGETVPSEARQQGRRLVLKFIGKEEPTLDRIEFHGNRSPKYEFRQRGLLDDKEHSFKSSPAAIALSIFLLDYLCARLKSPPRSYMLEGVDGSLAATLGYALAKSNGSWYQLFREYPEVGGPMDRVSFVFGGKNFEGKPSKQRLIKVRADYLPADCIEVHWDEGRLKGLPAIQKLDDKFRAAWKLPPATEGDLPEQTTQPADPPVQKPPLRGDAPNPKSGGPKPQPELLPEEPGEPQDTPQPEASKTGTSPTPWTSPEELASAADATDGKLIFEFKPPTGEGPNPETQFVQSPGPIPDELFEIQNAGGYTWEDSEGLLNFGDANSENDMWRIRDACEGLLIFGAVGSGKTSGSGAAVARAFLKAEFGGLVLTVKPDEAARWERMCRETGRSNDFIHVTPTSGHRFNFLQYEIQRPDERLAVTEDLINLFRTLMNIMSRSKGHGLANEEFWTNTTNQLMRKLIEVFLLAGEPVALDGMVRFINRAPLDGKGDWRRREMFADVLQRAQEYARTEGSGVDWRIFMDCLEYWTQTFPNITDATRSGFITSFTSMADVLSGRGIHEMLATDTNLTPELILSGKIVVLDIPLKGNVQGGLMVQAMFKLLFQQAVERRADKGSTSARPAFLWEDEGHLFFSQNDVQFQPTSRDCRAPHVIISQNLSNFFQQGHNQHAIEAVFSAMNTHIFHTNGDMTTNKWASERIGLDRTETLKGQGLIRPILDENISFFKKQRPENFKNTGGFKWDKEKEPAFPPEDFAKLKRGGDGTCDAVVFWLAHQFEFNSGKNFTILNIEQEPRQT